MANHTLAQNLTRLNKAREDIADAIVARGGSATHTDGLESMPTSIQAIPNQYAQADNGKVVSNGALISQTSTTATTNGTIDTTTNNEVAVAVPNTYAAGDEGKVVSSGTLVSQTTDSTATNGIVDTTTISSLTVNVPNTYAEGDEGKVVSNGALVTQGSDTVTQNGTVDTTLISSLLVNVSGGGSIIKLVPYWSHITNSDVYIVDSDDYIYVFGMYNADTNSGADLFLIPDSFDLSKLGTDSSTFGVRYKRSNTSSTQLFITIDTTTRIIRANGSYSGETVIISVFSKST